MKRKWIAALLLIAAACGNQQAEKREEKVPVTVATATERSVPIDIRVIGNVQPISTVAVTALAAGQLTRVWFNEGDDVRRGQMLFTIDPRPYQAALAEARANLAKDEANLHNAELQAERYTDLVKKDFVTKEEYDRITAGAESARAVVAGHQAAIQNANLQLSYCEIHSPIDGRTGSLQVHQGNLIKANQTTPLVIINQTTPVYVQFAIPESQLTDVRKRGEGLVVTATPQNGGAPIADGRLTFVDNAVDPATGTITLKATFPNRQRTLWPGQFVNVAMTLSTRAHAVVIPSQAVQTGQRGTYVYVVIKDGGVEMRPVKVFRSIDQEAVIDHGIVAGEEVITDGQLRLTPKSKIEIKQ